MFIYAICEFFGMHIGKIVQAAFLSGMIGCASQDWHRAHESEMNYIRDSLSFYMAEVEPLNVDRDGDLILSMLKPRLDVIRQYNPGIFPLSNEERVCLSNQFADVAVVYYNRQDYENALEYMQVATSIDGNNYRLFSNLGLIHYARNELPSAITALERALDLSQGNEGIQQLLDLVRQEQGLNK